MNVPILCLVVLCLFITIMCLFFVISYTAIVGRTIKLIYITNILIILYLCEFIALIISMII